MSNRAAESGLAHVLDGNVGHGDRAMTGDGHTEALATGLYRVLENRFGVNAIEGYPEDGRVPLKELPAFIYAPEQ